MLTLPDATTTPTEAAELYANLGFLVVPLFGVNGDKCQCGFASCEPRSAGKHPSLNGWQKKATADVDELRTLFRGHRGNVGLMMGDRFVCLDADGAEGVESMRTLGDLPDTLTARSGSGVGEHRIYEYAKHQDPSRVTNRTIRPKLDVKTRTGQIVVAPSVHRSGSRYEWINPVPPAILPDAIYQQLTKRAEVIPIASAPRSTSDVAARARAYVQRIDPAVSGSGGHAQTFAAARALAGFIRQHGLSRSDAWCILAEYNARCDPPWAERDLEHKLDDAIQAHTVPELADRPMMVQAQIHGMRPAQAGHQAGNTALNQAPGEWLQLVMWEQTKKGTMPVKHHDNGAIVLRYHPQWQGRVAFNTHSQEVVTRSPPWHASNMPADYADEWTPWRDSDTARLSSWLKRELQLDLDVGACERALVVAADANPIHPVRDWFKSIKWDRLMRLHEAPTTYFGAEASPYHAHVFRWWMIAAVARTFQPGCKMDNVLILEGVQGLKKSSALRALAGSQWFIDTPIDLNNKDAFLSLNGRLIVELAELESLRRADASRAKAFFTSPSDTYRPPYGRRVVTVPRQSVFAGTVNSSTYLTDPTGERRYWPIACTAIDLDAIKRDREQLWAEAVHWFREGEKWHPETEEERRMCGLEQGARSEVDEWETVVATYSERHRTWTPTIGEVLSDVLGIERGRWTRSDQMRVSNVLQRLGFSRKQVRDGNARVWRYLPAPTPSTLSTPLVTR